MVELSEGAIIGIAVAGGVVAIIILIGFCICIKRKCCKKDSFVADDMLGKSMMP